MIWDEAIGRGSARLRAFRSPVPRASRCGVQNLLRLNFRLDKAGAMLARCAPSVKTVLIRCVHSEKVVAPFQCARAIVLSPGVLGASVVFLESNTCVSVGSKLIKEFIATVAGCRSC